MRVKRRKTMALLAAVSIVCAQSTVSDVFAAGAEEVAAQESSKISRNKKNISASNIFQPTIAT